MGEQAHGNIDTKRLACEPNFKLFLLTGKTIEAEEWRLLETLIFLPDQHANRNDQRN